MGNSQKKKKNARYKCTAFINHNISIVAKKFLDKKKKKKSKQFRNHFQTHFDTIRYIKTKQVKNVSDFEKKNQLFQYDFKIQIDVNAVFNVCANN